MKRPLRSTVQEKQNVPLGLTFVELLNYRAQHQPHQLAYQYLRRGEQVETLLTYRQVQTQARVIARHLHQLNAVGGRALLLFAPGLDFVTAFLGCLYAGVTAVPAYPPRKNNKMARLQAIVTDAEATAVLTTADLSQKISQWFAPTSPLGHIPWISVDTLSVAEPLPASAPPVSSEQPALDQPQIWLTTDNQSSLLTEDIDRLPHNPLAFLQYTSGSTGTPKGVMVSQQNLMHNLGAIYRCFGHSSQSKGVIWLPPYHDMGLIGGILQPLYGGFPVTLMSPVDFLQKPLRWLQAISTHRATTSGGPDFAYDLCVRKAQALLTREGGAEQLQTLDLSSWNVAFTGAEPVRADTLTRFSKTFEPYGFRPEAFYPCYGMAETTLIVAGGSAIAKPTVVTVDAERLAKHQVKIIDALTEETNEETNGETESQASPHKTLVSCGTGLRDQQLIIVHPETKVPCSTHEGTHEAGEIEVGEIWVQGESVAQGYWRNPQKTTEAFKAQIALENSTKTSGPFLRTGDLGFLHAGELYITGRIKDMMIVRGINYYPQDIEKTTGESHESIKSDAVAAFSIEIKGAERLVIIAEVARTFVRKFTVKTINVKTVIENIRQAIASQYGLQIYAVLLVKPGQIPKTSSGKIQRYRCRELFLSNELTIIKDWSENPKHKTEFVKIQAEVNSLLKSIEREKSEQLPHVPKQPG